MAFDIDTINKRLADAYTLLEQTKADVDFLENAKRLLADPRASRLLDTQTSSRSYGELKSSVFNALPVFGGVPFTSVMIATLLTATGFVFTASNPINAVNESLRALEAEGKAMVVGRSGIAKLWTKAAENSHTNVPTELDPDDIDWSETEKDWLEDQDA